MILFMITLGILSGVIEMQGKANANGATVERNIVALRLKYHAVQSNLLHLAMLLDLRLPTGNEQEFLGTGKASTKILGILSKKIEGGTTHLNIGYQRRDAELDSDELEVMLGFVPLRSILKSRSLNRARSRSRCCVRYRGSWGW